MPDSQRPIDLSKQLYVRTSLRQTRGGDNDKKRRHCHKFQAVGHINFFFVSTVRTLGEHYTINYRLKGIKSITKSNGN